MSLSGVKVTVLGHASLLVESSGLRLLFDPILGETHSGGTSVVVPRRRIDSASLRPDFIFISHAHSDHFDPQSLAILAKHDPQTTVVTSDPLVEQVCLLLGFETVRLVPPATRIELDGPTIFTTPSAAFDVEWGAIVADGDAAIWNMVDCVFADASDVEMVLRRALGERRLDAALVPVQPMREIALATAGHIGFVYEDYQRLLACAAATRARCLVPSAAGDAHHAPYDAMNSWAYPVSSSRAARDLARLCPSVEVVEVKPGDTLAFGPAGNQRTSTERHVTLLGGDPPREFRPFEPVPLRDFNVASYARRVIEKRIEAWVEQDLTHAIQREFSERPEWESVRCALEVLFADGESNTYVFGSSGQIEDSSAAEAEVINRITGSMLYDVIEGDRPWTEPLLAGQLRSSVRGATIRNGRVEPLGIAPIFLYYAIPYRESVERAAIGRARRLIAR
jgi:L-ascorbate metabolism protein UlaG (beta-lactamase superfamily)